MKSALTATVLICLLLPVITIASTNEKSTPKPADNLNQPDSAKQTPDTKNNVMPVESQAQLLYEHHCLKCHESNVHIRNNNKAKNIKDVRAWVIKWQTQEKLGWDNNAINAVTEYLVRRYYKFKN